MNKEIQIKIEMLENKTRELLNGLAWDKKVIEEIMTKSEKRKEEITINMKLIETLRSMEVEG